MFSPFLGFTDPIAVSRLNAENTSQQKLVNVVPHRWDTRPPFTAVWSAPYIGTPKFWRDEKIELLAR